MSFKSFLSAVFIINALIIIHRKRIYKRYGNPFLKNSAVSSLFSTHFLASSRRKEFGIFSLKRKTHSYLDKALIQAFRFAFRVSLYAIQNERFHRVRPFLAAVMEAARSAREKYLKLGIPERIFSTNSATSATGATTLSSNTTVSFPARTLFFIFTSFHTIAFVRLIRFALQTNAPF